MSDDLQTYTCDVMKTVLRDSPKSALRLAEDMMHRQITEDLRGRAFMLHWWTVDGDDRITLKALTFLSRAVDAEVGERVEVSAIKSSHKKATVSRQARPDGWGEAALPPGCNNVPPDDDFRPFVSLPVEVMQFERRTLRAGATLIDCWERVR